MSKVTLVSLAVLMLVAGQASAAVRLLDSDFGFGLYPADWFGFNYRPLMNFRRFRIDPPTFLTEVEDETDKVGYHVGKDGFKVSLDVREFKPNEVTVKTVGNTVVVEAKHEEREDDHGFIARQFVRKYSLPYGYDPKEVVSMLSPEGVLIVKAPAPPESKITPEERVVQIQQTGPGVENAKDTPVKDAKETPVRDSKDIPVRDAKDIPAREAISITDRQAEEKQNEV